MREAGGPINFCVLTGGEPLLQIDARLVHTLHQAGYVTAIETNGSVSQRESCWDEDLQTLIPPDWIVCSPKLPESQLNLEFFDELKLVVPDYLPENYTAFATRARQHQAGGHTLPLLWLQPEDGPRSERATRMAIETALAHPEWRVSVQTHKILQVD
jgi:organic radical activating enzyme